MVILHQVVIQKTQHHQQCEVVHANCTHKMISQNVPENCSQSNSSALLQKLNNEFKNLFLPHIVI